MSAWVNQAGISLGAASNHVALTCNGRYHHYFYQDGTDLKYIRSLDGGSNWSSPVIIATGIDELPLDRAACSAHKYVHVFYCKQINSVGSPPQIFYRRSDDYGATWSSEVTIDNGSGVANNRFLRLSCATDGQYVHLGWSTEESGVFVGDQISYIRSSNNGASWGTEQNPFASAVGPGRPDIAIAGDYVYFTWTDMRDGTLNNGGETYFAKSSDKGATWGTEVNKSNTLTHDTLRPMVVAAKNVVLLFYQYPVGTDTLYVLRSTDYGATFGSATLFVTVTSFNEHIFVSMRDNFVGACWTTWDTTPHSTGFKYSKDYGATWSTEEQLPYTPSGDTAAPRMDLSERFACVVDLDGASPGSYWRNPFLTPDPLQTTLLDDFNRANDSTPPAGPDWERGVLGTPVSGEGLVIDSNQIMRKSSGSYRQGDYYRSKILGPNVDLVYEFSNVGTDADDGCWIYGRLRNPSGASNRTGYSAGVDYNGTNFDLAIIRIDPASTPALVTLTMSGITSGDPFALTFRDELIIMWRKTSGGSWTQLLAAIDTTYIQSGFVAFDFLNDQDFKVTNLWATELAKSITTPRMDQFPVPRLRRNRYADPLDRYQR